MTAADDRGLGLAPLPDGWPTVSIILPVRNEARFLERSLGAVLDQDYAGEVEVILVDGESEDGTAALAHTIAASRASSVQVLTNPERLPPSSLNLGIAAAKGAVIVRVDGHCVIDPDYVTACVNALRTSGAECVGGPMDTTATTELGASIAVAQSSRFGVGGVAFRTSAVSGFVDTVPFPAFRRELFDRIGPFDERFRCNEDDELSLRLHEAGGRIWMDTAIHSTYFARETLTGLGRQYWRYGAWKLPLMTKHRTVPSPRHLVPSAFVAAVVGSALVGLVSRRRWLPALVVGPYVLASAANARRSAGGSPRRTAQVLAATATMHVTYGAGMFAGLRHLVAPARPTAAPARPATSPTGGSRP